MAGRSGGGLAETPSIILEWGHPCGTGAVNPLSQCASACWVLQQSWCILLIIGIDLLSQLLILHPATPPPVFWGADEVQAVEFCGVLWQFPSRQPLEQPKKLSSRTNEDKAARGLTCCPLQEEITLIHLRAWVQ